MKTRTLVTVAVLMTLCACGGDQEPGEDPSAEGAAEVVASLVDALDGNDPQAACSFLADTAQRALEKARSEPDCIAAVSSFGADAEGVSTVDASDITVDGDRASAEGAASEQLASLLGLDALTLVRVDERWAIG